MLNIQVIVYNLLNFITTLHNSPVGFICIQRIKTDLHGYYSIKYAQMFANRVIRNGWCMLVLLKKNGVFTKYNINISHIKGRHSQTYKFVIK